MLFLPSSVNVFIPSVADILDISPLESLQLVDHSKCAISVFLAGVALNDIVTPVLSPPAHNSFVL